MGTNFGGPRGRYMLTSERYESDSKKKKKKKKKFKGNELNKIYLGKNYL